MDKGSTLLTGGKREGLLFWPIVLKDVPRDTLVLVPRGFCADCLFGHVRYVQRIHSAIQRYRYQLHAGICTPNLIRALEASKKLVVAASVTNGTSDHRFDGMPFGRFKKGSVGREGV